MSVRRYPTAWSIVFVLLVAGVTTGCVASGASSPDQDEKSTGMFYSSIGRNFRNFPDAMKRHVPNPENTLVIIFGHGIDPKVDLWARCPRNLPIFLTYLVHSKIENLDIVVFRQCSQIRGGSFDVLPAARADELDRIVGAFLAHGLPPRQIVVGGQSFGAWVALTYANRDGAPDRIGSVIAFAPGHGTPKHGGGRLRCREPKTSVGIRGS